VADATLTIGDTPLKKNNKKGLAGRPVLLVPRRVTPDNTVKR